MKTEAQELNARGNIGNFILLTFVAIAGGIFFAEKFIPFTIHGITDGAILIKFVEEIQPELKILVSSAVGGPEIISSLVRDLWIYA